MLLLNVIFLGEGGGTGNIYGHGGIKSFYWGHYTKKTKTFKFF